MSLFLALAVMLQEPTAADAYRDCLAMSAAEPARAEELASQWVSQQDGGVPARHCLGLAQLSGGDAQGASATFAEAARLAEAKGMAQTPDLYRLSGEAALEAGDLARAEEMAGQAITASARGSDRARAEAYLLRGLVRGNANQIDGARADLLMALQTAPRMQQAWVLLAAAERRKGNLSGAESAIREALELAPDDEATQREAALIAAAGE